MIIFLFVWKSLVQISSIVISKCSREKGRYLISDNLSKHRGYNTGISLNSAETINNSLQTHRSYSLWDADPVLGKSLMTSWPIVEYQQEKWYLEFFSHFSQFDTNLSANIYQLFCNPTGCFKNTLGQDTL